MPGAKVKNIDLHFTVLRELGQFPDGAVPSELKAKLRYKTVTRATVCSSLQLLDRKGFAERAGTKTVIVQKSDGNRQTVFNATIWKITDAGKRVLAELPEPSVAKGRV